MAQLTRRSVLGGMGVSLAAGAGWAGPQWAELSSSAVPRPRPAWMVRDATARRAEALISKAGLGGQVSFAVADAWTGAPLFERDAQRPMAPASTAKMLTAAYALDHLGPSYRFTTRVLATGPLVNGRLEGDLILAGGGDPGLSSDGLVALVSQLQGMGLREVAGGFQIWDGALPYVPEIDPGQPDHLGYNPALSGLNLNYNRVYFQWRRANDGYALSLDARTASVVPPVEMVTMVAAERSAPIYAVALDRDSGREAWSVARPALGKAGSRWLPVRGTAQYAGEVFRTIAAGSAPALILPPPTFPRHLSPGVVLARVESPPLHDLVRSMLRYSTNLTAEAMGVTATIHRTGQRPGGLQASASEMSSWLRAHGGSRAALVDHSGLGPTSRLRCEDMIGFLVNSGVTGPLWPLLKQINLTQPNGTPEPFELRAKTGTLNFVSCLSGFVRRPNGPPLAFAIQTAEPDRRAAIAPGDEERPAGARGWSRRSRALQHDLVRLWAGAA